MVPTMTVDMHDAEEEDQDGDMAEGKDNIQTIYSHKADGMENPIEADSGVM